MSNATWLFIIGGFFILVGVSFFLWGRKEARDLEEGLASHYDLREFMEHTPERPEPGALTTGAIIVSLTNDQGRHPISTPLTGRCKSQKNIIEDH